MKLPGSSSLYAQDVSCREKSRGEPVPSSENMVDKILEWPPRFYSPLMYTPLIIPRTLKMIDFTLVIRLCRRGQLTVR